MIPNSITKEHIINAIEKGTLKPWGEEEKILRSKKYLMVYGDKLYSPKLVISKAHEIATGEPLDPATFGGGDETNDFLNERGFKITTIGEADAENVDYDEEYRKMVEDGRVEYITFLPSYSYEDFIEGKIIGDEDEINTEGKIPCLGKDGLFKRFCALALASAMDSDWKEFYNKNKDSLLDFKEDETWKEFCHRHPRPWRHIWEIYEEKPEEEKAEIMRRDVVDKRFLLIIDKINRNGISKVFGGLINLLDKDKRLGEENETTVNLPYTNDTFGVPSNIYLVGTMDSDDKNIGMMEIAELLGRSTSSQKNTDADLKTMLDNVFMSEQDAEEARKYFHSTLEHIHSKGVVKNLVATTFPSPRRRIAINFGEWQVFTIEKKRDGYVAYLSVDMSLLPEGYNEWPDVVRKTRDPFYLDKDVGWLGIKWDPDLFTRRSELEQSWISALEKGQEAFRRWEKTPYKHAHREILYRWMTGQAEKTEPVSSIAVESNYDRLLQINNSSLSFKDFDVTDGLYFPQKMNEEINLCVKAALQSGKNIILTGPPGTGKTKIAKKIVELIKSNNKCVDGFIFTTATADWTTFDTIGGYHPNKDGGSLFFRPGIFLRCFKTEGGLPANRWLIIDEINRADIDKAFGQLFSVLSKDDVELPFTDNHERPIKVVSLNSKDSADIIGYSDSNYYVTQNWRLLATMNTYDKASLYEMSYAFMRRFAFIDVGVPGEDIDVKLIKNYIKQWKDISDVGEDMLEKVARVWKTLNKGKRAIGPAIIKDLLLFLKERSDDGGLVDGLKLYVLPQLEGMVKQDQEEIFNSLIKVTGNREKLEKAAKEWFEITLKGETSE